MRAKNVLSVLMQCLAITALVTVLRVAYGYSLAFDQLGMRVEANPPATFIGGISKLLLRGVSNQSLVGTVPESVYITFQMTFASITPALIIGAFAERMKFSAMMWFSALCFTLVYLPICHMVWVGWFGFNAGSAVAANGQAGMAILVTQISRAVAALTWMAIEWARFGKPSVLGFATGAIAGLAAVTPGAGTVGPAGALAIGIVAGTACFFGATTLKRWGGYGDSLDACGVHGVGGLLGTILVAIFAAERFGGQVKDLDIVRQLGVQALCAAITMAWSVAVTFVLLKFIDRSIGLRADEHEERNGLDLSLHNEACYHY